MYEDYEKKNWKISIGIENEGISVNYVYGVTYSDACMSARRQIEGNRKALGFLVTEA